MLTRPVHSFLQLIWGFALLTLTACAPTLLPQPANISDIQGGMKVGDIIDTRSGKMLSSQQLFAELAGADVVYVGEVHSSAEDHRVQLEVLRGLYAPHQALILGMEMFRRHHQGALNEYHDGLLSLEGLAQAVHWSEEWGFPLALYRTILTWAQERQVQIVGLNAPKEVVSNIARVGLAGLSPEERNRIARDFHLDDPDHQRYLREQYRGHLKESIKDFNTFFEAQLAWEETMAETLADVVRSLAPSQQVVVLIGKGHISNGVGVPRLTQKRVQHAYKTVAPMPVNYPGSLADPDLADYVWITEPVESAPRGRLGFLVHRSATGKGLEVIEVRPESPAARAGLKKGDAIVAVQGKPVARIEELHQLTTQAKEVVEIRVRRNNQEISLSVQLPP
jgi:aminopeptidase N